MPFQSARNRNWNLTVTAGVEHDVSMQMKQRVHTTQLQLLSSETNKAYIILPAFKLFLWYYINIRIQNVSATSYVLLQSI